MTLLELLNLLKKHIRLVVVLPIVCALGMGAASLVLMHNTYTASTSMYVLVQNDSSASSSTLYSDLNASQMVTNDVSALLGSDRVTKQTASSLGMSSLKGFKTSVSNATTSRVITLSVTGADPDQVALVANTMASTVSSVAQEVMNVQSVNVIDEAQAPTSASGPNRPLYVAVAFLAGIFAAVAIVVIGDMLNTRVRSEDELRELIDVPVIGRIPEMRGGVQ